MANQNDNSKRSNKKLIIILVAAFVVVVGVLAGVIIALLGQEPVTIVAEPTPVPNVLVGMSDDEIAARLQAMEDAQANIIVGIPIVVNFADGQSEGQINVQNDAANEYPFVVDYQLEDGTSVLKTGLIAPGYTVETQALDVDLEPGEYPVAAIHIAYDENGQEVGRVGVAVTFTVEN